MTSNRFRLLCCSVFMFSGCARKFVLPDSFARESMGRQQAIDTLLKILQPSDTNIGSCVVSGLNAGSLREGKGPLVLKGTVLEFPVLRGTPGGSSMRSSGSVSAGTYAGTITRTYRFAPARYTMDLAQIEKIRIKEVGLAINACGGAAAKVGDYVAEVPLGDTSAYVFFVHAQDLNSFVKAFTVINPHIKFYEGMGLMN